MTKKNINNNLVKSSMVFLSCLLLFAFAIFRYLDFVKINQKNTSFSTSEATLNQLRANAISQAKAEGKKTYSLNVPNFLAPMPIAYSASSASNQNPGTIVPLKPISEINPQSTSNVGDVSNTHSSLMLIPSIDYPQKSTVDSQPTIDVSSITSVKAGLLPNSPFYVFKVCWQTVKGWFYWGKSGVNYKINLSKQRLIESVDVAQLGDTKAMDKSLKSYNSILASLKNRDIDQYQIALLLNLNLIQKLNQLSKNPLNSLDLANQKTQNLIFIISGLKVQSLN